MENYINKNTNKLTNRGYYGLIDPVWDLFNDSFFSGESYSKMLKTDIKEYDDKYELSVEVPGIEKKDINISLEDGYLVISTTKNNEIKQENNGKVLRQERFTGSYKRSFYVGEHYKYSDISAKLANGILTINITKPVHNEAEQKYIDIE